MARKTLKIEANQSGKRYALVQEEAGLSVYAECSNYAAHVRGGVAKTWRYVKRNLPTEEAEALFARRVAGRGR